SVQSNLVAPSTSESVALLPKVLYSFPPVFRTKFRPPTSISSIAVSISVFQTLLLICPATTPTSVPKLLTLPSIKSTVSLLALSFNPSALAFISNACKSTMPVKSSTVCLSAFTLNVFSTSSTRMFKLPVLSTAWLVCCIASSALSIAVPAVFMASSALSIAVLAFVCSWFAILSTCLIPSCTPVNLPSTSSSISFKRLSMSTLLSSMSAWACSIASAFSLIPEVSISSSQRPFFHTHIDCVLPSSRKYVSPSLPSKPTALGSSSP